MTAISPRRALPLLLAGTALLLVHAVGRLLASSAEVGAGCVRVVGGALDSAVADCGGAGAGAAGWAWPDPRSALLVSALVLLPLLVAHLGARTVVDGSLERLRRQARVVVRRLARVSVLLRPVRVPLSVSPRRVWVDPRPLAPLDVDLHPALRRGPPVLAA